MITSYSSYVTTYQTVNAFSNYFKLLKDLQRQKTRSSNQSTLNIPKKKIQKYVGQNFVPVDNFNTNNKNDSPNKLIIAKKSR